MEASIYWPGADNTQPEGPRLHINPSLTVSAYKPWGYLTPGVQLVENNYRVKNHGYPQEQSFNRLIPRYFADGGLYFERSTSLFSQNYTHTLEPRLFYLNVPFHDQTQIPVYDSAYMIFNQDQLFRMNRYSGYDRIGDANQLAYALTSRLLSDASGEEKLSLSLGQIRYFANRKVSLCYDAAGYCIENPLDLGYLSPTSKNSPVTTRGKYHINSSLRVLADYVWDPYTSSTNNGYFNLHYQPEPKKIISLGYNYLLNGDITQVANSPIEDNALNQATIALAWPVSDRVSTLGVYSHNISKRYSMMSFLGLQYEDCCWAFRLLGGRTFKNISPNTLQPKYNSNVYFQILLKGLGSAANSDPANIINTYLPGYDDIFRKTPH